MNWRLSRDVDLASNRIKPEDGDRQMLTAAEILKRFDAQPGVILADEVGMGKTFVALAVAVSVVQATQSRYPVVVMIPPSVREKWPREWDVFREECVRREILVRASASTVVNGTEFLKLLDDPADRRNHIIFLTHGALSNSLTDPYVLLAIVRQAVLRRRTLEPYRRVLPRWGGTLFGREFRDKWLVEKLLSSHPSRWRPILEDWHRRDFPDDPVPFGVLGELSRVDTSALADAIRQVPLRNSSNVQRRLKAVRHEMSGALRDVWKEVLSSLNLRLPLLIMDEAHHLKNPWTKLASLFANEASEDLDLLPGTLGAVFDRMLFLTATPFQLGHGELLEVLRRFDGIRWRTKQERAAFSDKLFELRRALDATQTAALRLDRAWGRLDSFTLADDWWRKPPDELPSEAQQALLHADEVEHQVRTAERLLRPWVIRHARPDRLHRRQTMPGKAIRDDRPEGVKGLQVTERAVLPFLLAARAQALVSIRGMTGDSRARAFFAEGLASSFEAYRQTRLRDLDGKRAEDEVQIEAALQEDPEIAWYLGCLDDALPPTDEGVWGEHPKIAPTVQRCVDLWRRGEKVVVFCFYIETGRALRRHISRALENEFVAQGAKKLKIPETDRDRILDELRKLSERFFDPKSPMRREAERALGSILREAGLRDEVLERATDVSLRFLRTRSFLLRHMDIGARDRPKALLAAFDVEDASGVTLKRKLHDFGVFLVERVEAERLELLDALEDVNTGDISAVTKDYFDPSETGIRQSGQRESLLPNVRLANGGVQRVTRRRLMLAFNTPFFPEILVASSVMAEGVDLHLSCRHVIHHDLDWNPSVLEQRTGRLDRLGSHSERSGQPIVVYEPFLEATQDEKQYRVVKDRERWFNVIMGERLDLDEVSTDRLAGRVPLPDEIARRLSMHLEVVRGKSS